MKDIIKKAESGGYQVKKMDVRTQSFVTGEDMKFTPNQPIQLMVLDPLFWQALGKVCGWKRWFEITSNGCTNEEPDFTYPEDPLFHYDGDEKEDFSLAMKSTPEWKYRALRFHEINLTQSWEAAVAWLASLVA